VYITERAIRDWFFCPVLILQASDKQFKEEDAYRVKWLNDLVGDLKSVVKTRVSNTSFFIEDSFISFYDNSGWMLHPVKSVIFSFSSLCLESSEVKLTRVQERKINREYSEVEKVLAALVMDGIASILKVTPTKISVNYSNGVEYYNYDSKKVSEMRSLVDEIRDLSDGKIDVDDYVSLDNPCRFCKWVECKYRKTKEDVESIDSGGIEFTSI